MRYDDFRRSDDIDDRRDDSGGGSGGGGGFGLPMGGGGLGIGTMVVLGLIGWALGIDPRLLIGGGEILTRNSPGYQQPDQPPIRNRPTQKNRPLGDEAGKFVSKVLAANEDRWKE